MKKIILIFVFSLFLLSCALEKEKINSPLTSSKISGGSSMKTAVLETSLGAIKIDLFTEQMPLTTKNFIDLAEKGFFDGTRFHRVIGPAKAPPNGFMIQGGDPLSKDVSKKFSWGTGGPGYEIKDEFVAGLSNVRGTIAMANHGPNTGGSQFFINLQDNSYLDFDKPPLSSQHPVFGKVVKGMDVVDKIARVKTDSQDKPLEDVVIKKVKIK